MQAFQSAGLGGRPAWMKVVVATSRHPEPVALLSVQCPLGRHGPGAAGIHQGIGGPGGWPGILDNYAAAAA